MKSAGLYVHIPFCTQKCGYCDFFSVPKNTAVEDIYLECLLNEAAFYARKFGIECWRTIYIGGGTPSLLSAQQIEFLLHGLKCSCLKKECVPQEITVEMNPESVTEEKLECAQKGGAARLSLGIQSLNKAALRAAGRRCSVQQAQESLSLVRSVWKGQLSLDAIAGLPGQSESEFCSSLKKMLSFAPDHISLYTLTVEEGTPLERSIRSGAVRFSPDEADCQWLAGRVILTESGFVQYEVSNFCRNGKKSVHNSLYWSQNDYIGIGSGATGTVYGIKSLRWTNCTDICAYERFWSGKKDGAGIQESGIPRETEEVSLAEREFEFLMTGLRTAAGVDSDEYRRIFAEVDPWHGNLELRLSAAGLEQFTVTENGGSVRFSLAPDSLLFLNRILLSLLT